MFGAAGRAANGEPAGDGDLVGGDGMARDSGAYSFGQRTAVHRPGTAPVAGESGTGTLYIEPDSPWENGYCESFKGKLRDECWNGEVFYSLQEAQGVIGQET